jgi:hypothetical protein
MGGECDDTEQDEDLIPGDNDKPSPKSQPGHPNAPDNLTRIPSQGGDVPIVPEVKP